MHVWMSTPRTRVSWRNALLLSAVCLARPAFAQPAEAPPQSAPEAATSAPLAPPPDPQRTHGQLYVRMQLPPGFPSAALFLNNTFVGELPGGVSPAPLWLLPGGYAARISAPTLRSYEANLVMAPGQIIELTGTLFPETQPMPLVPPVGLPPGPPPGPPPGAVLVPPPSPPPTMVTLRPRRSASQIYRSVIYGIGFTALGLVVVGGVAIGIVCGAGKCKSSGSSSHHDFD